MTAVRDLGYKPYTGARLPPSNNLKVLFGHGMGLVWRSTLVKLAVLLGWLPLVVLIIWHWLSVQAAQLSQMPVPSAGDHLHSVIAVQLWALITLVSLGGGASAISADRAQRAFQFYFAKPVTATQYLLARIGSLATWCFLVLFVSGALFWMVAVAIATENDRMDTLGLVLPLVLDATLISVVVATCAVGVSAIASKPATTISAWLLLFVVPHMIAWIVHLVGEFDWVYLVSLPGMLSIVGRALFKVESEFDVKWFHALPVLAAYCYAALFMARRRLAGAEVIA